MERRKLRTRKKNNGEETTIYTRYFECLMCILSLDMSIIEIKVNVQNLIRWTIFIDNLFADYWYFTRHRTHTHLHTVQASKALHSKTKLPSLVNAKHPSNQNASTLNRNFYLRRMLFFAFLFLFWSNIYFFSSAFCVSTLHIT